MNYQEKAEQYVREKLPELMELSFGCEVEIDKDATIGPFRILGAGWSSSFECQYFYEDGVGHNTVGQNKRDITNIIGHPIQLQHWLRVLEAHYQISMEVNHFKGTVFKVREEYSAPSIPSVGFNLTTGQPATEADYQAFCEIVFGSQPRDTSS